MSPRHALRPTTDGVAADGFVLVGVAMFVLVLTILGLSLFTLSGFEAQFFVRSNERSEAFNAAASGIERARFALVATDSLQPVWQRLPGGDLEYAVALQGTDPTTGDSTGLVDWDGDDIWIRTVARTGQAEVVLQARFSPRESEDYYKRLITARWIDVQKYYDPPGGGPTQSRWSQTYMSGAVRLSDPDTSWNNPPDAPYSFPLPRPPIDFLEDPLPLPQLDAYFAAKLPLAIAYGLDGASPHYSLHAGAGNVRYFHKPPANPGVDEWTVDEHRANPVIDVTGIAVWLADPGIRFGPGPNGPGATVHVTGNPLTDRLIIVTRPRIHPGDERALNFESGIVSDVPLILVSDGKVRFDCQPAYNDTTRVAFLSVYANRVQIAGPLTPTVGMHLMHTASLLANYNETHGIIDHLYTLGVLPSSGVGAQGRLSLVPGTWQERSTSAN